MHKQNSHFRITIYVQCHSPKVKVRLKREGKKCIVSLVSEWLDLKAVRSTSFDDQFKKKQFKAIYSDKSRSSTDIYTHHDYNHLPSSNLVSCLPKVLANYLPAEEKKRFFSERLGSLSSIFLCSFLLLPHNYKDDSL